ncbi:15-hydroxyprostaglandin dehydrogenase [NAD(+)]-like isoform X1 [Hylaeus anthracinus]|uniref:15-hydroxyprostaglandin dehydrogenase [NAD(+)]-like isoform X1 n=1 Tax=Hylaeus anthracinus TaxID=313031 RepID=UPI0023B89A6C|nr:15-hydroxyprostaglandin dehydrogenase [NAD(+)]-like isoform X1 [Hylaeus anthracinus]
MLTRYLTSLVSNLLNSPSQPSFFSLRGLTKLKSCQFHVTSTMRKKKKKKKKEPEGPKIIKPYDCGDSPKPILDPSCKVAIVIGGSDGFGFAAADHLLCKGARGVVIADNDVDQGRMAAQRLCNSYGKNRVQFFEYDANNPCQLEATLSQAHCKYKQIHILFNDSDKERFPSECNATRKKENYISKATRAGLKILGKNHGGPGGIIVNCASILGFMGWPKDPFPVYCKKEPAIEVTMDFAEKFSVEETGVRFVALCPTNKQFCDIGLPDFPDPIPRDRLRDMPPCIPTPKGQIRSALGHVIAWAKSGSTWVVEPAISVHEIPRLIHFPLKEGEKIDPKIYGSQVKSFLCRYYTG